MDDTEILLDYTDADFVDIIGGKDIVGNIRIFDATGHVDFYGLKLY